MQIFRIFAENGITVTDITKYTDRLNKILETGLSGRNKYLRNALFDILFWNY